MEFKVDFHVHSEMSFDGRSSLDHIAESAAKKGLSAIFIADHNMFSLKRKEERCGVWLMPACEISTDRGHVLALFCDTSCDIEKLTENRLPSVSEAVTEIHRCGGIAVIAHPFQSGERNIDDIAEVVDFVEIYNSRAVFKNRKANDLAKSFAEKHGVTGIGGSDAHSAKEVGNSYTIVNADSVDDIRSALEKGNVKAVFEKRTPGIYKGLSQFKAAKSKGGAFNLMKAYVYIIYSILRDIF